jgi:hypothetical protein
MSAVAAIQSRMPREHETGLSPRARPVADAPIGAMLAKTDELARRWAIALIIARPLGQMADVPLEDFAREAPALCGAVIRALDSDAELLQLAAGGELSARDGVAQVSRFGALGWVPDARDAVQDVEALRGVLWEALLEEMHQPSFDRSSARLVADLSDRLAHVCATALAALLTRSPAAASGQQPPPARAVVAEQARYSSMRSPQDRRAAVIVDEMEELSARSRDTSDTAYDAARSLRGHGALAEQDREPSPGSRDRRMPERRGDETRPRPLPWDTQAPAGRPAKRTPEVRVEPTEGSGPEMRARRGSATPVDERS